MCHSVGDPTLFINFWLLFRLHLKSPGSMAPFFLRADFTGVFPAPTLASFKKAPGNCFYRFLLMAPAPPEKGLDPGSGSPTLCVNRVRFRGGTTLKDKFLTKFNSDLTCVIRYQRLEICVCGREILPFSILLHTKVVTKLDR